MKIRDISLWESFYWVAKVSNFTTASKKLGIGTSLLSKRINRLEAELDVRLFQRSTRKVKLTKDGEALLPVVEALLSDLGSIEEKFSNSSELSGTIRLTCVTALAHRMLAPLLIEFSALHPKIRFEVFTEDVILDLVDNQLDLGIRVQAPSGADYVYKHIFENKLVVCSSPKYLKNLEKEIRRPEDLLHHPILTLKVYEKCRFKKNGFELSRLRENRKIVSESGLYLTELTLRGAGVAIRSLWDVEPLIKEGKLIQLLENQPLDSFGNVYIVIPTRRLLTARVRTFIDFVEKKLKTSDQ
jgi:DNA-binding transcriptional LysR family regulator